MRQLHERTTKMKEIIIFKSVEPFFTKEADGRKPNTIRQLSDGDPRRDTLLKWIGLDSYGQIEITLEGGPKGFRRQVTDVSIYQNWFIISWKHPEPLFHTKT